MDLATFDWSTLAAVFVIALVLLGLAMVGMAFGVMTTGKCLQGSCGGAGGADDATGKFRCASCPNRKRASN
jgi:hypothetical protein